MSGSIWRHNVEFKYMLYGLKVKCSATAHVFEHLVPKNRVLLQKAVVSLGGGTLIEEEGY